MNKLFDTFLKFYAECEYLNHIIFTGSFGKFKVSKVYSCKELFEMENKLSTKKIFDKCLNELNTLVQEFNKDNQKVTINVSIKKFEIEEVKWCQRN